MPELAFFLGRGAEIAALRVDLSRTFPEARFLAADDCPSPTARDLLANDSSRARTTLIVVLGVPEVNGLVAFVRAAIAALDSHERRAIILPVCVDKRWLGDEALHSAFRVMIPLCTELGSELVFALRTRMLSLFLPKETSLGALDWPEFARDINRYGFSVERCPLPVRLENYPLQRPSSVSDFASFVALASTDSMNILAIDLSHLPPVFNGTTEYALGVSKELVRLDVHGARWVVIADKHARRDFGLDDWPVEIIAPSEIRRVFDLVFVPHQLYTVEHLKFLCAVSLRYVSCILDVVALRCDYLRVRTPSMRPVAETAARHANALIGLSVAGAEDTREYFESLGLHVRVEPILITKEVSRRSVASVSRYALVVGNHFHHKAIELFLRSFLADPPNVRLVVVADQATREAFDGVKGIEIIPSGQIPEERMDALYEGAQVIVFPSLYEGFGLPVLGGLLRNRPVLAMDNEVNRELKQAYDDAGLLTLAESHASMVALLRTIPLRDVAPTASSSGVPKRAWSDVARDTACVLRDAFEEPVDWTHLSERWRDVRNLAEMATSRQYTPHSLGHRIRSHLLARLPTDPRDPVAKGSQPKSGVVNVQNCQRYSLRASPYERTLSGRLPAGTFGRVADTRLPSWVVSHSIMGLTTPPTGPAYSPRTVSGSCTSITWNAATSRS